MSSGVVAILDPLLLVYLRLLRGELRRQRHYQFLGKVFPPQIRVKGPHHIGQGCILCIGKDHRRVSITHIGEQGCPGPPDWQEEWNSIHL
jgi:hypothetical protein